MVEKKTIANVQLGKGGYTETQLQAIKKAFITHKNVKITVLRSYIRDKKELKELSEKILGDLGLRYTARTLGYSIFIKEWRREVRKD